MGMLFVFIPRVSLRLPWAMCLLGLQPTLPKSETLVSEIRVLSKSASVCVACVASHGSASRNWRARAMTFIAQGRSALPLAQARTPSVKWQIGLSARLKMTDGGLTEEPIKRGVSLSCLAFF